MATRVLDDWIATYVEWTSNTESPDQYELWTAIGVLGAAMGQNWMQGDIPYDLANNIYFILFSKQGKSRKSTAIERGLKLLREIPEVVVSPSSISKEALHKQMMEAKDSNKHGESNYIVYAKELSSVVKTSGIDTPNYLIALFDEMDFFVNDTLSRGEEIIAKPHISFMSATTPNQLRTGFGALDMRENGLMSRTALIYADGPKNPSAFGRRPDDATRKKLIHDLKIIAATTPHSHKGQKTRLYFDEETRAEYQRLYDLWFKEKGTNPLEDAFLSRKELFVLKLACILTIAKKPTDREGCTIGLEIRMDELNEAIRHTEDVQKNLIHCHELLGGAADLAVKLDIRNYIKGQGRVTMAELQKNFYAETGQLEITNIVNQLMLGGLIRFTGKYFDWVSGGASSSPP